MKIIPIFFSVLLLFCREPSSNLLEKVITLNNISLDTTITFKNNVKDSLLIFREIEILENNNDDTLLLGYSIIHPKYIGKLRFIQCDMDKSNAAYLPKELDTKNLNNYSKLFTLTFHNKKENNTKKIKLLKLKITLLDSISVKK